MLQALLAALTALAWAGESSHPYARVEFRRSLDASGLEIVGLKCEKDAETCTLERREGSLTMLDGKIDWTRAEPILEEFSQPGKLARRERDPSVTPLVELMFVYGRRTIRSWRGSKGGAGDPTSPNDQSRVLEAELTSLEAEAKQ